MKLVMQDKKAKIIGIILLITLLCLSFLGSIILGYIDTNFNTVLDAYFNFNNSMEHIIIKSSRVPRALTALFVGSSLGVSGVLMQSLTKNPMASPSILGINSGASFFVVIAMSSMPYLSQNSLIWIALLGALTATLLVYTLAGGLRGDISTVNLTLAGAATAALFFSLTQGVLYKDQRALEEILFWLAGSVEGRSLDNLIKVMPYMVIGTLLAFTLSKKLNIFALGEEIAKGLGVKTSFLKLITMISIILLAGTSVAIAGPITLIGLVIPHITKSMVGSEHQWVIPYSSLLGAILLLLSDIGARFVIYPKDVPVGAVTALLGAPFFIYIARKAENK